MVEYAFSNACTAAQRNSFLAECYGPAFQLAVTSEKDKLVDVIAVRPDIRASVLSNMQPIIERAVNKGIINHAIILHLTADYFRYFGAHIGLFFCIFLVCYPFFLCETICSSVLTDSFDVLESPRHRSVWIWQWRGESM